MVEGYRSSAGRRRLHGALIVAEADEDLQSGTPRRSLNHRPGHTAARGVTMNVRVKMKNQYLFDVYMLATVKVQASGFDQARARLRSLEWVESGRDVTLSDDVVMVGL